MCLPVRFLLIPLIATSLALPALAAPERKPDATIKTKTIDAGISIDPALKAYLGLYPRLLAAGKREMAKWRGYADKDYRENPKSFTKDITFEFGRSYEQRSAIFKAMSASRAPITATASAPRIRTTTSTRCSGTPKSTNSSTFTTSSRRRAANGPTLRRLAAAIRVAVVAERKARGMSPEEAKDPMWVGSIKPDLSKIGAVALAPSTEHDKSAGLIVYFSPYAVGSYAEGFYIVFVPWTAFKAELSPAGAALFGGERPKGDADKDKN